VRVPVMLMDSMQRSVAFDAYAHQPGYARPRREARDAMIKRAENAWRKKNGDDDDDDDEELDNACSRRTDARSISDARAAATASYIALCARLRDAWRSSPSRDGAGGPDAEELLRRPLGGNDPDDDGAPDPGDPMAVMRRHLTERGGEQAQRERDRAWNSYKDQLSRAWQQGRTDPHRAVEVERLRGKYA